MRRLIIALAACVFALPVRAQLTTTYSGTQLVGDNEVPATAQSAVENGRVVVIMTGARGGRMIYDADFKMSDAERQTMLDMQGYLRNLGIMVKSGSEASRAFQ